MIHRHQQDFDFTGAGIYLGAIITTSLHEALSIGLLAINLFYVGYQVIILHKNNNDKRD